MSRFSPSLKTIYALTVLLLFGVLVVGALVASDPAIGRRVGEAYLDSQFLNRNVSNSVFSIYGIYRFYDTLFELLIFSTAVLGITIFSDLEPSVGGRSSKLVESHVLTASSSFLYPVIALFGIYLAYSAHQGPGGGFAGGVIGGSGVLLIALVDSTDRIGRRFQEDLMKRVEFLMLLLALTLVLLGVFFSDLVYSNMSELGVILVTNMAIGMKVFIGTWAILHFFVKHRGEI